MKDKQLKKKFWKNEELRKDIKLAKKEVSSWPKWLQALKPYKCE